MDFDLSGMSLEELNNLDSMDFIDNNDDIYPWPGDYGLGMDSVDNYANSSNYYIDEQIGYDYSGYDGYKDNQTNPFASENEIDENDLENV